jgi:hypothetical protein
MARALLAGTKTQTRRVVKGNPLPALRLGQPFDGKRYIPCPYGQPGDRLWVKETWARVNVAQFTGEPQFVYPVCDTLTDYGGPWKPSIHMPRAASRITLEITGVRVERLQDGGDREFWGEVKWDANPWVWVVEFERVMP